MQRKNRHTFMPRFEYDGIPAFRLNNVRAKYRKKLLKYLSEGKILLKQRDTCPCGNRSFVKVASKDRFGYLLGIICVTSVGCLF